MMKLDEQTIRKKAMEALLGCFRNIPFVEVKGIEEQSGINGFKVDFLLKLNLSGRKIKNLIVEVKSNGQPRFAREAINLLLLSISKLPDSYGVFVAPFISPEAAELCSKNGIGYIDLSGNCFLSFEQVFIKQEGNRNLFVTKRNLRSLYSPIAERALRTILSNPKRVWKVKELSLEANVSVGWVSNIKKMLNDREWLKLDESGFSLAEPLKLLTEWSQNYNYRRNEVRDFYSMKSIPEIEADIANACDRKGIKYALTGFSGAARFAPSVRYQRVIVYIQETDDNLETLLNLKAVPSGANVSILKPYDEGVFHSAVKADDTIIASPVQIYLDLLGFRGRGEEAAETILKEVILPKW